MNKKYIISLPSFTQKPDKNDVPKFFNLIIKIDKNSADNLIANGYNISRLKAESSYTAPEEYPGDKKLLFYLFLQDLKRFRPFNTSRYFSYCYLKQYYYNLTLTEQEQKLFDKILEESKDDETIVYSTSEEHVPVTSNTSPPKIILLASSGQKIGKSVFSSSLTNNLDNSSTLSIVQEIRDQLTSIFNRMDLSSDLFNPPLYNQVKDSDYVVSKDVDPVKARNLICDYSDLLQMHLGVHIWGRMVAKTIDARNSSYVIIDDFRRQVELDYLINYYGKENILTVYLDKDNVNFSNNLNSSTSNYEFQLNPKDMDVYFKFNSDWSNSNDLIEIIKSKLS